MLPKATNDLLASTETLTADSRLLLEADRPRGAALLHAEACTLLLRAWLLVSGADPSIVDPRKLPSADTLAKRFRSVWLERSETPSATELRAMADGLRSLVAAVRSHAAPPPAPPARRSAPVRSPEPTPRPLATRRPEVPQPASPPAPRKPVSSTAFWSLIDRWGVADREALTLIGHVGGLTKRGTRPRFRLAGAEAERYHQLQTLDDALSALGQNARAWLRASHQGQTPLDTMLTGGDQAVQEATRRVVGESLRRSLC